MKISKTKSILLSVILFIFCNFTNGENNNTNITSTEEGSVFEFVSSVPYCFNFTWLGPRYDNSSVFNISCLQYKDETSAEGVPCADPFVITYDGTEPDIDYLWANYRSDVLCRQASGDSCIKWTYYYDGQPMNVTRFCGRAWKTSGDAIRSGCYSQQVGGYEVEFCACQSSSGGFKPCNSANSVYTFTVNILVILTCIFNYYFIYNHF